MRAKQRRKPVKIMSHDNVSKFEVVDECIYSTLCLISVVAISRHLCCLFVVETTRSRSSKGSNHRNSNSIYYGVGRTCYISCLLSSFLIVYFTNLCLGNDMRDPVSNQPGYLSFYLLRSLDLESKLPLFLRCNLISIGRTGDMSYFFAGISDMSYILPDIFPSGFLYDVLIMSTCQARS